ncbi:MAG: winged helix-turn-helix domain-containing protein [Acidobacteriia bacterium]|nr:winged helix-turn-helix domain-containing protein [Terriglobia bacterium]
MARLQTGSARYRFGPYEADARLGELRKHGLRIQLQEKSFEVLMTLLEHPGELVTREELQHRLWPEGVSVDFDNSLNSAVNRLRDALRDRGRTPRYIQTFRGRGYRFIVPVEQVRGAAFTLAVLPFGNLSHDSEQDLFGDAVADVLTTELGSLSTLRVISRQSVLHLKGTEKTVPEIAHELNADAIVEGTVQRAGDRIRITAQLVQASPEQHLWAKTYDCDLADVLTVQGRVAHAIAGAVQLALTPAEVARLDRARPVDPEAHLAYLKGRHHMGRWSRESFEKALEYFHLAFQRDPRHALAYAYAAVCYGLLGFWGHLPFRDAYQKAKESAQKAIALDDALSTAHYALGWASWMRDWDLATCERETLRAIELNPSDEFARQQYSIFLVTTSEDCPRAVREIRLALDLDPLSQFVNGIAAWIYLFVKDYEGAIEQARKTLELFPGALQAYWIMGLAEMCRSRYAEAIAILEKAVAMSRDAFSIAYLGSAHARAGNLDVARSMLRDLLALSEVEAVPPRCFVFLYGEVGERDQAFAWMEKAYQARDSGLFFLRVIPVYDPLRSDPRFDEMLRRIGIPRTCR